MTQLTPFRPTYVIFHTKMTQLTPFRPTYAVPAANPLYINKKHPVRLDGPAGCFAYYASSLTYGNNAM